MNKKVRNHIYFPNIEEDLIQNTSTKTKLVPMEYYIQNEITNLCCI